jgi:Uma2 family endonuclease
MKTSSVYRVTVPKFRRMAAAGLFDDDRVELLDGVLTMMTTGPAHDYAVAQLGDLIGDLLPRDRWFVREEKPLRLGLFWQPQPDIAVVRGPRLDFASRTPGRADVALIVEVSDTTYAKDAGKKLRLYERCGVPTYWLLDLSRRQLEVREMGPRGLKQAVVWHENDEVPLVLDGQERGGVSVNELLV